MDWNWFLWALPALVLTFASWAVALLVYWARPERFQNRILAFVIALEGIVWATWFGVIGVAETPETVWALRMTQNVAMPLIMAGYLVFLGTIPTSLSRPLGQPVVRRSLLVVGLALAIAGVFWPRMWIKEVRWMPHGWDTVDSTSGTMIFLAFALVLIFGLVVAMALHLQAAPGTMQRAQARTYLVAFGTRDVLVGLSWPLFSFAPAPFSGMAFISGLQTIGFLVYLVFLPYGILKHQLFDIDLRIKWGISRGTLAGIVLATFLVVSQVVERLASDNMGLVAGSVSAGLLLFLIQPLQGFADRVANAAMPRVQNTPEYLARRKQDIYRGAVEAALLDGHVSEKERDVLARLAHDLGISPLEARNWERETASANVREANRS